MKEFEAFVFITFFWVRACRISVLLISGLAENLKWIEFTEVWWKFAHACAWVMPSLLLVNVAYIGAVCVT